MSAPVSSRPDTGAPAPADPPAVPADRPGVGRRRRVLVALAAAAVLSVVGYLVVDAQGSWSYALALRGRRVVAMVLVGYAIGLSTLVFQTVTNNRILTPSIMGFDALYVLVQTVSVFFFGTLALLRLPVWARFAFEVGVMLLFAALLYRLLFGTARAGGGRRSLYVLVLAGIVCGALFGSLTSLVSRLIDPNDFITLQDRMFASFGSVDDSLLLVTAVTVAGVSALGWGARHRLDVLALGRDASINLGVEYGREVRRILAGVVILVSVSTALVGPFTFFGLLVANLGRQMVGTSVTGSPCRPRRSWASSPSSAASSCSSRSSATTPRCRSS